MKKALCYGVLSSFFFASTFLLNKSMNLTGGHWLWSGCLRYMMMLPLLTLLLLRHKGSIRPVWNNIKANPGKWILWASLSFGAFYALIAYATAVGESWLVAASWQLNIVAGILLTPVFGKKIPLKNLWAACFILIGVFLMQFSGGQGVTLKSALITLAPILVAAVVSPLGNRKMLFHCDGQFSPFQWAFGMTLCSMPFWLVLCIIAFFVAGPPSGSQLLQSLGVAICSGILGTTFYFKGQDVVRNNIRQLALVESTQSLEVVFTLIGSILLLGAALPTPLQSIGLVLVVVGMALCSLVSR